MIAAMLSLVAIYVGAGWLLVFVGMPIFIVLILTLVALGIHWSSARSLALKVVGARQTADALGLIQGIVGVSAIALVLEPDLIDTGGLFGDLFWLFALVFVPLVGLYLTICQWSVIKALSRKLAVQLVEPAEEPDLHAVLDRLCALIGQPKPQLAISPEEVPNSYTVGLTPDTAVIIITKGLRRRLGLDELTAALAHELAHLKHRDVAFMTIAAAPATILAVQAREYVHRLRDARIQQTNGVAGVSFSLLIQLPFQAFAAAVAILAYLPVRALSRYRELAADRAAAEQVGRPADLAAALVKLHDTAAIPTEDLRQVAAPALGIVGTPSRLGRAFATHPPLQTRLAQLNHLITEQQR